MPTSIAVGARVAHRTHGWGTVLRVRGAEADVRFDDPETGAIRGVPLRQLTHVSDTPGPD